MNMSTRASDDSVERLRELLRPERRDELLRKMSPENRALLESIEKLRERIGHIDFDVVAALRELRNGG